MDLVIDGERVAGEVTLEVCVYFCPKCGRDVSWKDKECPYCKIEFAPISSGLEDVRKGRAGIKKEKQVCVETE